MSTYSYICLWIVCWISNGEKSCAYFKFESPDIRDHILTAHEHSTVQIVFHLEKLKCQNISSSIILIEKFFNNSYVFICRIRHVNDECTPSGRTGVACQCVSTNGTYSLTKTVERLDSTHWRWKWVTSEEKENITYITFNILYMPQVINLTMNGYFGVDPLLVHKGGSISILCSWKNGNPPVYGRLLKSRTNALIPTSANENISKLLTAVNCTDSGVYSCEADNSERNMSATLLVKCPPVFTHATSQIRNITLGRRAELTFSLSSYTADLIKCKLYRMPHLGNEKGVSIDCSVMQNKTVYHPNDGEQCWCIVEGIPPDLILNVALLKVSDLFDGMWQVFVENHIGSDDTKVFFRIINEDVYTPPVASISINDNLLPTVIGVGIAIGLGVITSICVVLFIILNKWKKLQLSLPNGNETSCNNSGGGGALARSQDITSVNVCDFSKIKLEEDNAMSASLNSSHDIIHTATSLEPNVRWLYEKADSMQVVFHIKGRQSVLDNQQCTRIVPSQNVSLVMPSAPGYSTLERLNMCVSDDKRPEKNFTHEQYLTPCPPTYCQPSEFSKHSRADDSQDSLPETGIHRKCLKDIDATSADLNVRDANNYYYSTID